MGTPDTNLTDHDDWTVVLLYPYRLWPRDDSPEIYTAEVRSEDPYLAVEEAQKKASDACENEAEPVEMIPIIVTRGCLDVSLNVYDFIA